MKEKYAEKEKKPKAEKKVKSEGRDMREFLEKSSRSNSTLNGENGDVCSF